MELTTCELFNPTPQNLNTLQVLSSLFGPGDKEKEDPERMFSGAQALTVETDH